MKTLFITFTFFLFFSLSAQEDSISKLRSTAIDNIADVEFNTKAKPIRDRAKAFENANGIKIQYRVENQSLDKLGGLSEHLFKLFQTFTSNENVNAKVITGEFSALQNNALSDVMSYKTNATNDLTQCCLPLTDTQKKDSLYSKFLQNGLLSTEELNMVPENLNGLYPQAMSDYENILYKHSDCPDVFNSSSYNQHVFNTKQLRANEWTSDINALSITISSSYGLLSSSNSNTISPKNNGSTRVNLNIDPKIFQGHYVLNMNNSMNPCTEEDLEVRCRMLYNKTGIHFLFVTFDLNYFLPVDSMNTFRDAAVQTFSTNYTDNVIVALYLRMKDGNSNYGSTLLIKQINGTWLTQADISFANYNNGGTYIGGTVSRFNNVFKNIPKPLILCYQVAKVNGLLSTAYFIKSNEAKGKEQIYVHVLKLDKAFDELKQLDDQLHHLIVSTGGSGGSQMGTTGYVNSAVYDEIDQVRNKIKITYVKAARTPSFMDADVRFKEVYLQDTDVVESASLNYLKSTYGSIFKNNRLETLTASHPPPQDLVVGSCKTQDESDVIADGLNLASFILSPTGLDFIPDALSVAYYASTDQLTEAIWASSAFLMPGIAAGAKKVVSSVVDAIKEMNAGSRLIKEAGQLQAIQQDKNLIAGLFNIKPENINSSLATKINDNPTSVNQLLLTTEKEAKLYSHVSSKLDETKRVEFLNKSLDEPSWRQKVIDDPDEVLKWAGVFKGSFGKDAVSNLNGFSDNINGLVSNQGITISAFKSIEEKQLSNLSLSEKSTISNLRNEIPQPTSNTLMQKVIPKSDISKYTSGQYTSCRGFLTTAADSKHLSSFEDIYYGMRLDYPNTNFSLSDGSCGVIRFKSNSSVNTIIPRDLPNPDPFPFTNHGFTSGSNGRLGVPEWKLENMAELKDGAELWEVFSNGSENIIAIFNKDLNKFVPIQ